MEPLNLEMVESLFVKSQKQVWNLFRMMKSSKTKMKTQKTANLRCFERYKYARSIETESAKLGKLKKERKVIMKLVNQLNLSIIYICDDIRHFYSVNLRLSSMRCENGGKARWFVNKNYCLSPVYLLMF